MTFLPPSWCYLREIFLESLTWTSSKGVAYDSLVIFWLSNEGRLRLRSFDYGRITRITGNFGTENGEEGFMKVAVAVKMLSKISGKGDKEFQAEVKYNKMLIYGLASKQLSISSGAKDNSLFTMETCFLYMDIVITLKTRLSI